MTFLYNSFKKMAFKLDAEKAHHLSIDTLSKFPLLSSELFGEAESSLKDRFELDVSGLSWKFPVGLAAGLDKNGQAIDFFSRIPFGAVEVGTVTPLAQAGNPKPRLFRYPNENSLRNCMGFNNAGADELYKNLQGVNRYGRPLGVNLGKNKITPNEFAPEDYRKLYERFHEISDYLVVNVSSPNTPGLRDMQKTKELEEIFMALEDLRAKNPAKLFLKISPDLNHDDIPEIINVVKKYKLSGLMATNTTVMPDRGVGGVSGDLLFEKAKSLRSLCLSHLKETPDISFIGVGGFSRFSQMWDYWKEGGRAIQIYSSFIFQGPALLWDIHKNLDDKMNYYGLRNFEELLENIKDLK